MASPETFIRTFSAIDDERSILDNGQIARPFFIASGWTTLRIGVRLTMSNNGLNIPVAAGNGRFYLGLSSGAVLGTLCLDATPVHWAGVCTSNSVNDWLLATHSGTVEYFAFDVRAARWVNGVFTNDADLRNPTVAITANPALAKRIAWYLDITRVNYPNAGNYTFKLAKAYTQDTGSHVDVSKEDLKYQGSQAVPVLPDHLASNTGTLSINETANGELNAVNIGWNVTGASTAIEISDVGIWKVA